MRTVKGTVKDGHIALAEPVDWPEGRELRVARIPSDSEARNDAQADDPESIARWIAEFDAIPPLQMTPAEEAQWQAARNAQRELERVKLDRRGVEMGKFSE
jgi:hypothetical protein